jgi:DNA-binding transcriptional LysR family regulator
VTNWDDLRIFLAVLRHGSHSRAGRALRVDPTTVGRRLAALETDLGTALFERTPAGLTATPAGQLLGRRAERIETELLASERELSGRDARLEGEVRITAGDAITTHLLVPWMLEFQRAHPGIRLEFLADNAALDLTRLEADLAVRLFRPRERSLVAVRAGALPFSVFGSAAYFTRRTRPRTIEDLADHDWIEWGAALAATPPSRWLARHVPKRRVLVRASTTMALIAACAAGYGLALLPTFAAETDRRLVAVSVQRPPPGRDVWIVTHADTRGNARVRAVVSWLREGFGR